MMAFKVLICELHVVLAVVPGVARDFRYDKHKPNLIYLSLPLSVSRKKFPVWQQRQRSYTKRFVKTFKVKVSKIS
jgi:hypothetical protein